MIELIFAVLITTSAGDFDVEPITGTFADNEALLTSQPWFGDGELAFEAARALGYGLGVQSLDPGTSVAFAYNAITSGLPVASIQFAYFFDPTAFDADLEPDGFLPQTTQYVFATVAQVPIGGICILLTLMLWIVEARRWRHQQSV